MTLHWATQISYCWRYHGSARLCLVG